jgi:hypothetical protein
VFVSYALIILILSSKVNPKREVKSYFLKVVVSRCRVRSYVEAGSPSVPKSLCSKGLRHMIALLYNKDHTTVYVGHSHGRA